MGNIIAPRNLKTISKILVESIDSYWNEEMSEPDLSAYINNLVNVGLLEVENGQVTNKTISKILGKRRLRVISILLGEGESQ